MTSALVLAPFLGAGIGMAAAYGVSKANRRVHFVKRDKLNQELDNLDIQVSSGETCVVCHDELDPDDVGAIVREEGEYKVVCNKPTCLDTYDID